jgi:hypothetical protein
MMAWILVSLLSTFSGDVAMDPSPGQFAPVALADGSDEMPDPPR